MCRGRSPPGQAGEISDGKGNGYGLAKGGPFEIVLLHLPEIGRALQLLRDERYERLALRLPQFGVVLALQADRRPHPLADIAGADRAGTVGGAHDHPVPQRDSPLNSNTLFSDLAGHPPPSEWQDQQLPKR